ncbi:hypothetical protein LWI29_027524 [Acer saccharum]|uniref:Uncharacterized protein n=1 Tax=Acer saccharum TaxID=4024 RepID=A0AA39V327_ACESA|nr:hypothetical protein LWI29_013605 [Acer saccharum]KAK0577074.1 hypothetical protein LWI29_027524 [Acer saccharum]
MTDDGVNDAPALKKADIGSAVADSTDAACSASDIVLIEPGLSAIISSVLTSRAIFQGMKNYTIATVISDTANWKFAGIKSLGWGWTWVIWLFNIVTYLTPDPLNFAVRDMHSGQRVIHTLKGKVESFAKLRGYDIDAMNNHYTL